MNKLLKCLVVAVVAWSCAASSAQRLHYKQFERRMSETLDSIRRVLDTTREPLMAESVPHTYEDKYALAESVVGGAIAAAGHVLRSLGFNEKQMEMAKQWVRDGRTVTLQFLAEERCEFLFEDERIEEGPTKVTTGFLGSNTEKKIRKIKQYHWKFDAEFHLTVYPGVAQEEAIHVTEGHTSTRLMTATERITYPPLQVRDPIHVDITWLISSLMSDEQTVFSIDRTDAQCHTPRRNSDVNDALNFFDRANAWAVKVVDYYQQHIVPVDPVLPDFVMETVNVESCFVPIIAAMDASDDTVEPVFSVEDLHALNEEGWHSLSSHIETVESQFEHSEWIVSPSEIRLLLMSDYLSRVTADLHRGVSYVEAMMENQLRDAIGHRLSSSEFSDYMDYHNGKLFNEEYKPMPFTHAVRRPDHYPEGTVAIEDSNGKPIMTTTRVQEAPEPMKFSLNAGTEVTFSGTQYVHGWMAHRFADHSVPSVNLAARARQFSTFLVLVGRVAGPDTFEPEHGFILRNKDHILLPLLLDPLPTPKQFVDAISSLSPEQQRFARAFRSMQLESTMFGVVIIQIKPQLERVLNLPVDSLTKEIELTEDLLELLMEYQIPTDILSYEGDESASTSDKIEYVKRYVDDMWEMIGGKVKAQVNEAKEMMEQAFYEDVARGQGSPYQHQRKSMVQQTFGNIQMDGGAIHMMAPEPSAPDDVSTDGEQLHEAAIGDRSDLTGLPVIFDEKLSELDVDDAVQPTIIKTGKVWTKKSQNGLRSKAKSHSMNEEQQNTMKDEAFDLLDALTRSGVLTLADAELHVVMAATHSFDRSLIETVIQDNVNPIESVERSTLILASTIHQLPVEKLVSERESDRVLLYSPMLFTN